MLLKTAAILVTGLVGVVAAMWVMWNYNFNIGVSYVVAIGVTLAILLAIIKKRQS